ncbi:MAG: hypothetical protein LAO55_13635 [Acidobacteriia bacterium]|nr:hypothetical protein [Terriglobia bacterium]
MATGRDLTSGWTAYEICIKGGDGQWSWPFSDALAAPGSVSAQALNKMRMVRNMGWPEAQRLRERRGKKVVVPKDDVVWLLKCKPSFWRLYFYVWEKHKRIVYLHACYKDQRLEDPSDHARARSYYDGIARGTSGASPFDLDS